MNDKYNLQIYVSFGGKKNFKVDGNRKSLHYNTALILINTVFAVKIYVKVLQNIKRGFVREMQVNLKPALYPRLNICFK